MFSYNMIHESIEHWIIMRIIIEIFNFDFSYILITALIEFKMENLNFSSELNYSKTWLRKSRSRLMKNENIFFIMREFKIHQQTSLNFYKKIWKDFFFNWEFVTSGADLKNQKFSIRHSTHIPHTSTWPRLTRYLMEKWWKCFSEISSCRCNLFREKGNWLL